MENEGGINAQKLKDYRLKVGLSQNALDKKAGVGGRTVRNAENGKSITVASLRKIAKALDVPPAVFLD